MEGIFDATKAPSYSMFAINILMLLRYFVENKISISDRLLRYKKEAGVTDDSKIRVFATSIRVVLECIFLILAMVFILLARYYKEELFSISSVLVVAGVSFFIIIFTAVEETIHIAINMFLAEPCIYIKQ